MLFFLFASVRALVNAQSPCGVERPPAYLALMRFRLRLWFQLGHHGGGHPVVLGARRAVVDEEGDLVTFLIMPDELFWLNPVMGTDTLNQAHGLSPLLAGEDALDAWPLDTVGERQQAALTAAGVAPQIEAA